MNCVHFECIFYKNKQINNVITIDAFQRETTFVRATASLEPVTLLATTLH